VIDAAVTISRRAAALVFLHSWAAAVAGSGVAAQIASVGAAGLAEYRIFPARTWDTTVPTPSEALGYEFGRHLATYAEMAPYLERLAASSERVMLDSHGESYEGRPIYNLTISSPENLARLDEIRAGLARLADPRTLSGLQDAESILRNSPLVVMLVFATDGAETAGPEAAMQVAWQLAAGTDARTLAMLRETIVIIVPAQNPDSNQRAVAWYNAFRVGPEGTADPDAAEHQFPWGINSNTRYQIDPNRESVWSTQGETRAIVGLYRRWNPQVFVDNHGEYPVYTGPWYAEPLHEVLTARQRDWHRRFGEAIGAAFTQHAYAYRPWDYGQFDPGYWDSYSNFSGAIAWTTETTGGGSRGIRLARSEGAPFTLADGIIQHVIASDVTIGVAAENREQLLRDFLTYKTSAIEEGRQGPVRAYAISAHNDPQRVATVVNTMRRNAIEVHRTTRDVTVSGARAHFQPGGSGSPPPETVTLPAGSYVLSMAQPESRMLRVLMEPEARFSDAFLDEIAKARATADEGESARRLFYDITAWSMPLTYHLEAYELTEQLTTFALERVDNELRPHGQLIRPGARRAFLVDYTSNAAISAAARLRREGVVHRIATDSFTLEGHRFSAGTVAILPHENPDHDVATFTRSLAEEDGVTVVGVDSLLTDSGVRLDTEALVPAATRRIAVVMDRPVSTTSYGHIWYTFERIHGIDFTALNFDRLTGVDLKKYDVLILPDGNYNSVHAAVAAAVAERLRIWVDSGGTLIGIRGGSAWIAREEYGLTAARMRKPAPGLPRRLPVVPGTIFRATITDARHPLIYGYVETEMPVMLWSALAFDSDSPVEAPLRIADAGRARVSGFVFPESLAHVAGSPYVVRDRRGAGSVVLFLDDPNFRLFWDGLRRLFINAVFLR
jgi:hypothetical protein